MKKRLSVEEKSRGEDKGRGFTPNFKVNQFMMHCFWIQTPLIYNIFDDNQYMAQFMAFG